MSCAGPIRGRIALAYRRVSRSISICDISLGLQVTPPFPPPKGMFTTAHFHVIHVASAFTSSSVTLGWNRIPPLAGPRVVLC